MWTTFILSVILSVCWVTCQMESKEDLEEDFGAGLIASMRNDANLDLPVDEEYEDLRAELLAYHTALAKLKGSSARRSMGTTSCWKLGGICINYKMCNGYRYLTEVPGCKDKLNVCCFRWNEYKVKDLEEFGISGVHYPWSKQYAFGGEGVVAVEPKKEGRRKKGKPTRNLVNNLALLLREFNN